jgi:hypothetical protein
MVKELNNNIVTIPINFDFILINNISGHLINMFQSGINSSQKENGVVIKKKRVRKLI